MSTARNLTIVIIIFALAIVGGIVIDFYHPPARMPASATRLTTLSDPTESVIGWIDGGTALMRNHVSLFTLNVKTGATAEPPGVAKIIAAYPQLNQTAHMGKITMGFGDLDWSLSPDRRWIAACLDDDRWIVAKLDGTDTRTCPGIEGPAWWLPDSTGWVAINSADNPTDGTFAHLYKLGKSGIDERTLVKTTEDDIPAGEEAAMIAPDTMLMFFDENHRDYDQTEVVKFAQGKTDVMEDDGDPAAGSTMPMSAELSPDGAHIVWTYLGSASIMQSVRSMKDASPDNLPWQTGILVTDGRNKGRNVIVPDNAGKYTNPHWMPDSRHISVIHDNALWSVPAV